MCENLCPCTQQHIERNQEGEIKKEGRAFSVSPFKVMNNCVIKFAYSRAAYGATLSTAQAVASLPPGSTAAGRKGTSLASTNSTAPSSVPF